MSCCAVEMKASTPKRFGISFVWGIREAKPIHNIPADALSVKLRLRNNSVAKAFVRYADRVEQWAVSPRGGLMASPEWELAVLQAVNFKTINKKDK